MSQKNTGIFVILSIFQSLNAVLFFRGDENERCSQLAQYRSIRVPRDTENFDMNKTPEMDKVKRRMHAKFGRYQVEDDTAAEDETGI